MNWKRVRLSAGAAVGTALGLTFGAMGLASCEIARPFAGPGYSKKRGVTLPGAGETVTVGITNAQVDGATRKVFDDFTQQTIESLPSNDGFIGYSVRSRVLGNEVWTMTVWRDEAALDGFVGSSTHRAAMRQGLSPVIRAKFLRFAVATSDVPPKWDEVLARLEGVEFTNYRRVDGEAAR
jgi:heme-degrading monooxygenase HmoA